MTTTQVAGSQLKLIVDKIERLAEEKDALAGDIREVYSLAKGHGFDVPTIRKAVAHRKKLRDDQTKVEEAAALLDLYLAALDQPAPKASSIDRTNVTPMHMAAAE